MTCSHVCVFDLCRCSSCRSRDATEVVPAAVWQGEDHQRAGAEHPLSEGQNVQLTGVTKIVYKRSCSELSLLGICRRVGAHIEAVHNEVMGSVRLVISVVHIIYSLSYSYLVCFPVKYYRICNCLNLYNINLQYFVTAITFIVWL